MKASCLKILALLFCICGPHGAALAAFPDHPVRIIVPFPPGGGTDTLTRILASELTRIWNQQVLVDNRSGAQGNIGTAIAAKSPPDGYTLVLTHQGVMTVNPYIYTNIGFDPLKDLMPITRGSQQPFILVVNPALPAKSLKELTELAKKQPGKYTFASSASGPQMAGEMYKMTAGIDLLHVPYKGAGPAVVDLLAGQVDMMFSNPTSAAQHIKAGKLRALAVFALKRNDAIPDVPTSTEAGYPQLSEMIEWYGYSAPAGTPAAIIAQLNTDLVAALNAPEAQKSIRAQGLEPSPSTPEQFARQIRVDSEKWGKVAKASGVKVE
ncbi:MAG TPA: tripartite tricarboxylate transporter substrate binding protein [Burkholderiales bacterium]|nr:tripartite tricarboxylate transporter substrate binding protein [Burkholderiales bacterium]